jgi:hypothetical protein
MRNKGIVILAGVLTMFSTLSFGAWVPEQQALEAVKGVIRQYAPASASESVYSVRSITTDLPGNQAAYYIAQLLPQGFVLISAEDNVFPVLAYSFSQAFLKDSIPVHISDWLALYRSQILYHRSSQSPAGEEINSAWATLMDENTQAQESLSRDVQALLTSTWNQGNFYNGYCPEDPAGPGGRVYAGCVATAMAQVMYYYRHPETGVGSSSYNYPPYGTLSANYGNTTYCWNEMLSSISGPNDAIAELQYHCGIAVEMMYSPSGSGAYSSDAAAALRNYFRYSSNTQLVYKDNYSDQAWKQLLKDQLDLGQPMYYHGYGSGGHAFNVDGYQGDDYFHFNWGWGGSFNGYYFLTNLNPGGSSFTNGQGAIINIVPAGNYPAYCSGQHLLTAASGTFEDGSGPVADYEANASCSWLIAPQLQAEDSITSISIAFERFETEDQNDKLIIYQGNSVQDPIVGTFSGTTLPSRLSIDGNQALVVFTSNDSIQGKGFLASYTTSVPDYCQKSIFTLTDSAGEVSDGSGDKFYNDRTICHWIIQPDAASAVVLEFTEFDTEPQYDFVDVYEYDPVTTNGIQLGRFSGSNLPPLLVSNTGAFFITFFTNASVRSQGWKANYRTSAVGLKELTALSFQLYPNPASEVLNLSFDKTSHSTRSIQLVDMQGRVLIQHKVEGSASKASLDLRNISAGVYLIRATSGKESFRQKFIRI